jgi:DNA invertase Pin-like site-specific DNA recombinase
VSAKEYLYGRKRRLSKGWDGTRTALYLRVSTADQKPDLQYDGLRTYAAQAGLDVVQDYCDVGVSGRREGRPHLNAPMSAARNRDIDCVLVWKFDRFARSTRHLLAALEEFNHLGVRFISVQDQIDTDSPMGRAMFTIIGAMAELEASLISERVTAGMRAAEARGTVASCGRCSTRKRRSLMPKRPELTDEVVWYAFWHKPRTSGRFGKRRGWGSKRLEPVVGL